MQISNSQNAINNVLLAKTMEKLSSGLRINRAADDAAGLAISEKLGAQIRGSDMASRNVSDSISMVRTAEGALNETHSNLQRMRELAVQAGNGIYTDSDRDMLQAEMRQLQTEVTRTANSTEFNTRQLLDGTAQMSVDGDIVTTTGPNSGELTSFGIGDMRGGALGIDGLDISTQRGAMDALEAIDKAIEAVSGQRGELGATENRFESTVRSLDIASENQQAAASRISDADMAKDIIEKTTYNIRSQISQAMTAQANMQRQNVLNLIG
jgi:flagellin